MKTLSTQVDILNPTKESISILIDDLNTAIRNRIKSLFVNNRISCEIEPMETFGLSSNQIPYITSLFEVDGIIYLEIDGDSSIELGDLLLSEQIHILDEIQRSR